LSLPHPLEAFELVQGAIEGAFQGRFVAEQAIQLKDFGVASPGPRAFGGS